jgi:subtilisin family serine protease
MLAVGCDNTVDGPERETVRLVVDSGGETEAAVVADDIAGFLGTQVAAEPLFANVDPGDDPDGLSEMFLVFAEMPDDYQSTWDLAYGIRDALGYDRVEPDQENELTPAAQIRGAVCTVGDSIEPPADKTWSLDSMNVRQAWDLVPEPGGRSRGAGISVCHPDTGWSEHNDLDRASLDLDRARNFLFGESMDASDPLDYSGLLLHPGHGTATGSVIISSPDQGEVTGVAPEATLVPIRTAMSVVQAFDSDLARSVQHSVNADCDVISMSLGGRAFFGLRAAIRNAKRNNLIVLAAAGNCVGFVVAPAVYEDTIAVAGTDIDQRPWRGSSRGRSVAVSAPGQHVYTARRRSKNDPVTDVTPGEGTSFAVASTAGVVALWLAHHGLDSNTDRFGPNVSVQDIFLDLMQGTAQQPEHWTSLRGKYGAGVVDAEALLRMPLPEDPPMFERAIKMPGQEELEILAATLDMDIDEMRPRLATMLGVDPEELLATLDYFGAELIQLALEDSQQFRMELDAGAGQQARSARQPLQNRASTRLRGVLEQ